MILVVEDDPISRRALKSLFTANGFVCRAVTSAEEALSALNSPDQPEMVLIDIDLPGMSGLQLLHRLQNARPDLSCTLMSADYGHDLSPQAGHREVPFFPKPLNAKRLVGFLRDPGRFGVG
jgi:two-component system C4-dicarboxylate transport response regulator DctD